MIIRAFDAADTEAVVTLWRECELTRPWNDPYLDIERKQRVQPELFLVGQVGSELMATAMAGYDGHRGWVNYLAVAAGHRRSGVGRRLMTEVERLLQESGCPKLNLLVRAGNEQALGFYRALGYVPDGSVSLGKRLIED